MYITTPLFHLYMSDFVVRAVKFAVMTHSTQPMKKAQEATALLFAPI